MARTSKGTVKVKLTENTEIEVTPSINFSLASVSEDKLNYLVMLGLKQRIAAATRARIKSEAPEILKNKELKEEMLAFGMPGDKVEEMFKSRPMEFTSLIELSENEIFPSRLEEDEDEPEPEPEPKKKGKK